MLMVGSQRRTGQSLTRRYAVACMLHPFNTRTLHAPEERLAVAAVAPSHRLRTVTSLSHDPQLRQLAPLDLSIPANDRFSVRAG